jgi:hypothetical protein
MSPNPYPNTTYPTAWDEANMVKAPDVPVNVDGTGLTVTDVVAGQGPLMEPITGADVKGLSAKGDNVTPVVHASELDSEVAE